MSTATERDALLEAYENGRLKRVSLVLAESKRLKEVRFQVRVVENAERVRLETVEKALRKKAESSILDRQRRLERAEMVKSAHAAEVEAKRLEAERTAAHDQAHLLTRQEEVRRRRDALAEERERRLAEAQRAQERRRLGDTRAGLERLSEYDRLQRAFEEQLARKSEARALMAARKEHRLIEVLERRKRRDREALSHLRVQVDKYDRWRERATEIERIAADAERERQRKAAELLRLEHGVRDHPSPGRVRASSSDAAAPETSDEVVGDARDEGERRLEARLPWMLEADAEGRRESRAARSARAGSARSSTAARRREMFTASFEARRPRSSSLGAQRRVLLSHVPADEPVYDGARFLLVAEELCGLR